MQDSDNHQDAAEPNTARRRLERLLGGRPLSVYGVLLAGIGVLVVLLAIVYVTGRSDGSGQEAPPCLRGKPLAGVLGGREERGGP